jgi:hypothetical protein
MQNWPAAIWGIDPFRGLPHDPRTKYYRGQDKPLDEGAHLYEFLIPIFPESRLDMERVSEVERDIYEGGSPTALAIPFSMSNSQRIGTTTRILLRIGAWPTI